VRWLLGLTLPVIWACTSPTPTDPDLVPPRFRIVSGGDQAGPAGQRLPAPIVVLVLDSAGKSPLAGYVVNWEVTAGGGSVPAGGTITSDSGLTQTYWTLGPELGTQMLEARAVNHSQRLILTSAVIYATAE
jgi:hypothetical protein